MAWAEAGGAAGGAAPSECMWAALELTSQRSTEQDMDRRIPRTAPGDWELRPGVHGTPGRPLWNAVETPSVPEGRAQVFVMSPKHVFSGDGLNVSRHGRCFFLSSPQLREGIGNSRPRLRSGHSGARCSIS